MPVSPPEPTAILDWIIWYPEPNGSFSGFIKVNILSFWYGFKKEITKGNEVIKIKKD